MADLNVWGAGDSSPPTSFPIAISQGGTGAADAAGARANLGVYSTTEISALIQNLITQTSATGSAQLPVGTTAERAGNTGAIRYNSDGAVVEYKTATVWKQLLATQDLSGYFKVDGTSYMTGAITFNGDCISAYDGIGHSAAGSVNTYISGSIAFSVTGAGVYTNNPDGYNGYGHNLSHVGNYVATPRKPMHVSGRYYGPVGLQIDSSVLAATTYSGKILFVPFQPHNADPATGEAAFTALAVNVTTLIASKSILLGIYADDGYGAPGALLQQMPVVSFATTGVKDATAAIALQCLTGKEVFWLAFATDSTATGLVTACTAGIAANQQTDSPLGASSPTAVPYVGYTAAYTYTGTLPDTVAGTCTPTALPLPCIWAKA